MIVSRPASIDGDGRHVAMMLSRGAAILAGMRLLRPCAVPRAGDGHQAMSQCDTSRAYVQVLEHSLTAGGP